MQICSLSAFGVARARAASRTILSIGIAVSVLTLAVTLPAVPVQAQQFPDCVSASSDADGDGWGWENNRSCVVVESSATSNGSSHPECRSDATDPDGDGFGYEDGRSCIVQPTQRKNHPLCINGSRSDSDGDGYGWENNRSCIVVTDCINGSSSDSDGDGYGWENNATCIVSSDATVSTPVDSVPDDATPGDSTPDDSNKASSDSTTAPKIEVAKAPVYTVDSITDVVLVTGQSNVLGADTGYDSQLDQPDAKVFAYTDIGWQVADLHQVWDRFLHPGNHSTSVPGREPTNSFAFHFGKSLVRTDVTRVVAFIVVPAPGQGISHWDAGSEQYRRIQDKVTQALDDIPHKDSVDAVLWHQGENDFLYEGTADADPTGFVSTDSFEYKNYYQIKLNQLIKNFRGESWASQQTAFICGETRRGVGVNRRLNALNTDNDPLTACVPATDLPKRADDQVGSHFSAEGLRALGQRYADKYFEIK